MADDIGQTTAWFYCLKHQRVEAEGEQCKAKFLLGPYSDPQQAAHALETHHAREKQMAAEDAAWRGDDEPPAAEATAPAPRP